MTERNEQKPKHATSFTRQEALELGFFLRGLMEDEGLTIKELARMTGAGETTIGRLLRGENQAPSFKLMVLLAKSLGLSMDEITPSSLFF